MSELDADRRRVEELLGREPGGAYEIVVRNELGDPAFCNAPLLESSTHAHLLLAGRHHERRIVVSRATGVRRSEAEIPAEEIEAPRALPTRTRRRNAAGSRRLRPSAGVGGTRRGVKCLHAHYAWYLAGGDDPVGRWGPNGSPPTRTVTISPRTITMTDAPVAAIDMGTNSTRLLVHDGEHTIERLMTITRLGQDVDRTGRSPTKRSNGCSRACGPTSRSWTSTASPAQAVATSAARDAANRDEFFTAAHDAIGVEPELLSGFDEGKLCPRCHRRPRSRRRPLSHVRYRWWVHGVRARHRRSRGGDVARHRLCATHREVRRARPATARGTRCVFVDHRGPPRRCRSPDASDRPYGDLRGLAGTVSIAAAVELGLAEYDRDQIHHFVLKEAAEDVYRTLVTEARGDASTTPVSKKPEPM